MAYRIAEDPRVATPVMVNLDGFALTHTYEQVHVPTQEAADAFLPPYATANRFDFDHPVNIGYSAGPAYNRYYKYRAHEDMCSALSVIGQVEAEFAAIFGRTYTGAIEPYACEDADFVLVTLGTISGLAEEVVRELRAEGVKAGSVRIRYMRPFPYEALCEVLSGAACVGVLEKDISFGAEGTVFTNVNSALQRAGVSVPTRNFVGGLGGDDISREDMHGIFAGLQKVAEGGDVPPVTFLRVEDEGEVL
jgi:pyruvate ferredoxin oxidoreductase alpha subunit